MDKKKIIILVLIIGAAAALYFYSVGSKGEEGSAEDPKIPDLVPTIITDEGKPKKSIKELADSFKAGKYIQEGTVKEIHGYYFLNPQENPFINPLVMPGFLWRRLKKRK